MAVPKKRTSKSKTKLRKTVWKSKALKQAIQAYFIASRASKKVSLEKTLTNDLDPES